MPNMKMAHCNISRKLSAIDNWKLYAKKILEIKYNARYNAASNFVVYILSHWAKRFTVWRKINN